MSSDRSSEQSSDHGGLSRRDFLQRAGYFTVGAAVLAACGSSSKSSSSGSNVSEPGGGAGGALSSQDLATIKKFIGPIDPKYAGAGETWNIGGAFPFTTSFAVYGTIFTQGLKLGIDHIKQLGGPNISVDYRDIGLDDVVMTRNAYIAFEHYPVVVSSLQSGGLIAKDLIAKNKNFTIDPGGGNNYSLGLPYFWGMTFNFGNDGFTLAGNYFAKQLHQTKMVIVVYSTAATTAEFINPAKADLGAQGCEIVKVVQPAQGTTDWSDTLTAIRSAGDFDVVSLGLSGNDIGVFLKQYKTSGINKTMWTWEGLHGPVVQIAGMDAYEKVYLGGVGEFSPSTPNPWAQVFVRSYRDTFGNAVPVATPDYYSANYYSCAFLLWRLYMDVKAKGGDVNDGSQIQAALQANPMTPGVIGGDATTAGIFQFDLNNHGLQHYPMGFYQIRNGQPVELASSDIGGANIKIIVPGGK
jgi:ABC-type branched-subunit amino acid transport system substrate-binding protein